MILTKDDFPKKEINKKYNKNNKYLIKENKKPTNKYENKYIHKRNMKNIDYGNYLYELRKEYYTIKKIDEFNLDITDDEKSENLVSRSIVPEFIWTLPAIGHQQVTTLQKEVVILYTLKR